MSHLLLYLLSAAMSLVTVDHIWHCEIIKAHLWPVKQLVELLIMYD